MPKSLVIVESPTKARTIAAFLGADATVESSMGHIRDLPRSAAEIPAKVKGEDWARLGVNVENDFEPLYVVPKERKSHVKKLKELLKDADELYLATDEDREGEAIAWHLVEVLKPKIPVKRMVFHEITKPAIEAAFSSPRDLDERLISAQEARRILDRLYGYEVSPVLWKKVQPKLSAGRVQSVAIRIVVERERERMAFVSAGYWSIEGSFAPSDDDTKTFAATLHSVDEARIATGKDFDAAGKAKSKKALVLDQEAATELATGLQESPFEVRSVESKPYTRKPYPPFRTSTLQQEAGRKLRYSSSRTMSVAQRLYENGYITYMRTDSVELSDAAVSASRAQITKLYGKEYLSPSPRKYSGKQAKGAQEAHEAIRPAGDFLTPEQVGASVGPDETALYDLIWKRTVASQMADAKGVTVSVRLGATAASGEDAVFAASGRTITFPGFLRAYVQGSDDPDSELDDREKILPPMEQGDSLTVERLEPTGHETRPPARYTEASLVQKLEELGVGRPSTYASIMTTIQDRGYVFKKSSALVPTFTAFGVVGLLENHFPNLVDYEFTASMESDLDRIAGGEAESTPWLAAFYFGDEGLKEKVATRLDEIDPRLVNSIPLGQDESGNDVVARVGRYGPYVERGDERGSIPDDLAPDEVTVAKAIELIELQNQGDKIFGTDPDSGMTVYGKTGRFGPYVQLGEQEEGSKTKPKRASLFKSMELDALGLDDALKLLSLPRSIGEDDDGVEIMALNGRYGPYIQRGEDKRSLETEDQLFSLTVPEALKLLAEPPRRRGQARQSNIQELGEDPVSGKKVTVRSGRYGPYVTDGEVNASLTKGDTPEKITIERAAELLQARRDRLGQ